MTPDETIKDERLDSKITTTMDIITVILDYGLEQGVDLGELINRIKQI